ncbi:alpha/beta hydrolase [Microbacterium sp. RD1]|uniref:alpha/beta hydrolase n=1 Tax=Microbacterium sp. RD1 TaxID=3457313 RepID=UPI003FA53782
MSTEQRTRIDAALRAPRPTPQNISEMRAGFAAGQGMNIVPDTIVTTETSLGGLRALLVEPAGPRRPGTILYFHGGAWSLGAPETSLAVTGNLVARSGISALSVEYQLAPENPFPAAIEDGLTAYRALLDENVDPAHIVLAGDSAGGSLALTTLLKARDAGLPLPAAVTAFSPALDLTFSGESMDAKSGIDPIFTRESLTPAMRMYVGSADARDPLLSPALFADLTGVPPMLLQVGGNEVLLDDSARMAARAVAAGVDVVLDVTADVPHVFQAFAGRLDEADAALDRAALFLQQHVAGA